MSKDMRLVDFQIKVGTGGDIDEERAINIALFPVYESVRLWLKERNVRAPFRKLAISLADEVSVARWHGHVSVAIGICEVTEATNIPKLRGLVIDHRWVLGIVEHALSCVVREVRWRSPELEKFIEELARESLPLVHFFEELKQVDVVSGTTCTPWLSTQPGETKIGVRFAMPGEAERYTTVLSSPGPIFLEDAFPLAKTKIKDGLLILLDKAGSILASMPLKKIILQ